MAIEPPTRLRPTRRAGPPPRRPPPTRPRCSTPPPRSAPSRPRTPTGCWTTSSPTPAVPACRGPTSAPGSACPSRPPGNASPTRPRPLCCPSPADPHRGCRPAWTRPASEARTDGAAEIGTQHLLAGLLAEGVAAAILERLGVHADAIRSTRRTDCSAHPPTRRATASRRCRPRRPARWTPPRTTRQPTPPAAPTRGPHRTPARRARARPGQPGPARPQRAGRRHRRHQTRTAVPHHRQPDPTRPLVETPPRRAHTAAPSAARTSDPDQLVNGPGVTICRACVALAAEILATRQPGR